jgi:hypothetical protein
MIEPDHVGGRETPANPGAPSISLPETSTYDRPMEKAMTRHAVLTMTEAPPPVKYKVRGRARHALARAARRG